MNNIKLLFLFLFLGFSFSLYAQSAHKESLKIGIITDLHYLSSELHDNGYRSQEVSSQTGKNIVASEKVLDETLFRLDSASVDVLLITGDLTFEGEKLSHLELQKKLGVLMDKGVKIFVIPGNHDINNPFAKGYKGNLTYSAETINQDEFRSVYADFGYEDAIEKDLKSLSYVSALDSDTWLLALDVSDPKAMTERSVGTVSDDLMSWIEAVLDKANGENKRVIAMMHWGLLEHIPFQSRILPSYLVSNAEYLKTVLINKGVEIIFTGHFHANDINKYTVGDKNLHDIATGALVSYPYAIRFAELFSDKLIVKTEFIESTQDFPSLAEDSRKNLVRLSEKIGLPLIKKMGFSFSEENLSKLSFLAAKYLVASFKGDEQLEQTDVETIRYIFDQEGFPIGDISVSEIDFWDNVPDINLTIPLK